MPANSEPNARRARRARRNLVLALVSSAAIFISACGGAATAGTTPAATTASETATASAQATAPSVPGDPPGNPPGGGTSTEAVTGTGAYSLDGGAATETNLVQDATAADQSSVLATNAASLTLINPTLTSSGDSSSSDASSFYGLDAGVLATSDADITITGGTVTTTGDGANGVFAYGEGASITMSDATISATGRYAHGAMTSGGGSVTLSNVDITTSGANSAALATDRGGGTVTATGGTVTTSGQDAPALYSTGTVSVTGGSYTATGAEAAVIEGANSIVLKDVTLASTVADKWGVMIFQSMSGDAEGNKGTFTMTGGSLSASGANSPLFFVTNSTGVINLSGVKVEAASGVLVNAAAATWGTSGANGGTAILTADAETLVGDLVADAVSAISATLQNGTSLTGTIDAAELTLDATSTWTVTGTSHLTTLTDEAGVSGTTITNIIGNGNTVTYDAALAANSWLAGATYTLAGGGTLSPA